jgi:peptidoglycan-N-acetylglucosamine deacetylase
MASVLAFGAVAIGPSTTRAVSHVGEATVLRGVTSPEGAAQLDWQPIVSATHYLVERNGLAIAKVDGTSHTDWAGGRLGGTHEYTVRAVDASGTAGEPSNVVRVRVDPTRYSWAGTTVRAGPGQRPQVALTFDDCYGLKRVEEIARVLRRNGASATFFCTGQAVSFSPATFAALVPDFELANHTWSHPQLNHLTHGRIVAEVTSTTDVIEQVTGTGMAPVFRAPGGRANAQTRQALREMGLVAVKWDVDTRDWNRAMTSKQVRDRALGATNGSIVLMHTNARTAAALPSIIEGLQGRGFELVTVSKLLGVAQAERQPVPGPQPRPTRPTLRPWGSCQPI